MNNKYCLLLLTILVFITNHIFSQNNTLQSTVTKIGVKNNDSTKRFKIKIENNSDTSVCVLLSELFFIEGDEPIYLPVYQKAHNTISYALWWAKFNTQVDVELLRYKGIVILPKQYKDIIIDIEKVNSKCYRKLKFEYFAFKDFDSSKLMEERKDVLWYKKYSLNTESVTLISAATSTK